MSDRGRCNNCRFWDKYYDRYPEVPDDSDVGHCKRFPPVFVIRGGYMPVGVSLGALDGSHLPNGEDIFSFPHLRSWEWCGEWKPKDGNPSDPQKTL